MARLLPRVKLIAVLRNPVDRAYSHYQSMVKIGLESLSFEEALEREAERLQGEAERMSKDESYWSLNYDNYSYLLRGIYSDQLEVWMSLFPKEQFLILTSETLFAEPAQVMTQVFEFLGLPPCEGKQYKRHDPFSLGPYPEMSAATRRGLVAYFAPHNRRLSELLKVNFDWDQ